MWLWLLLLLLYNFTRFVYLIFPGVRPLVSVLYVFTFAVISPLGAAIGLLMSYNSTDPTLTSDPMAAEASLQNAAVTVLQGLATGTLLYVVFFEVIEKERSKGTNGMLQVRHSLMCYYYYKMLLNTIF